MIKDKSGKFFLEEFYKPPRNIQEEIFNVYEKYIKWRTLREQPYKQFNNVPLEKYLQEAREKFWGYLPLSYDLDVPQFFFPETRNQIIDILGKIANLNMKPIFEGVENFDIISSTVLRDLFEYWKRKKNTKISNFWKFLYTVLNGTCIVFVGYRSQIRDVKTITLYDPDSGETEYSQGKLDESDIVETICNLEDIYIPKIWEPDIQEQGKLIWRTLLKFSDFKDVFKNYPEADYVIPGMQFSDLSIFSQFLAYDVRGGEFVEVIKYFDAYADKYMIIANGVLLNPVKTKNGKMEISPLPWNHKKLPFAKTIFEPLDANFFYGMPLAQKVKSPQEALNKMWELLLEREVRSISAPIITNDPSIENGLEFKPGRIYQVQGDINQYRELQVSSTSSSYWNTILSLQNIIQKSGSGGLGLILPSKQPRSATEKSIEENIKRERTGIYYLFYQDLLEQIVWLVLKNMIQFYTSNKVEKIIGSKRFHKIISLIETQLVKGGIGNHEIRITDIPSSPEELKQEAWYRSLFKKERVEIIEVTPQMLQQLEFDIKIKFDTDYTPAEERAMFLDYIRLLMGMFGNLGLIDPKKVLFRLTEKMGENISDVLPDQLIEEYHRSILGIPLEKQIEMPTSGTENVSLPNVQSTLQNIVGRRYGVSGVASRQKKELGTSYLPNQLEI